MSMIIKSLESRLIISKYFQHNMILWLKKSKSCKGDCVRVDKIMIILYQCVVNIMYGHIALIFIRT